MTDDSDAILYFSSNNACVNVFGMVLGISINDVIPPAAAAFDSEAMVALWVKPGSLKCT